MRRRYTSDFAKADAISLEFAKSFWIAVHNTRIIKTYGYFVKTEHRNLKFLVHRDKNEGRYKANNLTYLYLDDDRLPTLVHGRLT